MRETITTTTESGHTVIHYPWITMGESRELTQIYANAKSEDPKDMTAFFKSTDEAIRLIIVSLDGDSENILTRFINLPKNEADEISELVSGIVTPKKK